MNQYSDVCMDCRGRGGTSGDRGIAVCDSLSRDSGATRETSGGPTKRWEVTRALYRFEDRPGTLGRRRPPASDRRMADAERARECDELPRVRGSPSTRWPPERPADLEVTAAMNAEAMTPSGGGPSPSVNCHSEHRSEHASCRPRIVSATRAARSASSNALSSDDTRTKPSP